MRATFVRGIEAIAFSLVIFIVIAGVTMIVTAQTAESPVKPKSLAEWDNQDIEAAQQALQGPKPAAPKTLESLGFEPPPIENPLLPAHTSIGDRKADNLLNLLHNYYFIAEDRMLNESIEYVDRDSGYVKVGLKSDPNYALTHVGKHVKYLLALAKFRVLHPTIVIFDEDYERMNDLVRKIFETHPPKVFYGEETFFDLLELNRVTGEQRYLDYADYINDIGVLEKTGEARSLLEQNRAARTYSPGFLNSVIVLQHYAQRGKPLLIQAAKVLYDGIITACYSDKYKMFFTQVTYNQPDSQAATATTMFKTSELAVSLHRMMDYYDATGDEQAIGIVDEIISAIMSGESELNDSRNGLFYTKYIDKGSEYKQEDKRADVNMMLYSALVRYLKYDDRYLESIRGINHFVDQMIYDENYNGFYSRYDSEWTPVKTDGIYQLSLTDAILGAQIFLNNEEIIREWREAPIG